MPRLVTSLQDEILARLQRIADAEGVLHLAGREVHFWRGADAADRATRAMYALPPRKATVVPPAEIAPGTWVIIL